MSAIALQIYARFNRRYTSNSLTASAAASVIAEECFGSIRTVCSPCLYTVVCDAEHRFICRTATASQNVCTIRCAVSQVPGSRSVCVC